MVELIDSCSVGSFGSYALRVSDSKRCWRYYHEGYCITLITQGFGYWRYRNRDGEVSPERLLLMEPGEVHTNPRVEAAGSFTALFLDPDLVHRIAEECDAPNPHFKVSSLDDPAAIRAVQAVLDALDTEDQEAQDQLLSVALQSVLERAAEHPSTCVVRAATKVRRGARILKDRYLAAPMETVAIHEVAAEVGMSYHWFVHSFRAEFGLPPYQFVKALRLSRVRQLMLRGPDTNIRTLQDIAATTGYSDTAHMNRDFKREHGMTPFVMASHLNTRWRRRRHSANIHAASVRRGAAGTPQLDEPGL